MDCGLGLIFLLILYIFFDINYFLRCIFIVGFSLFRKKVKLTDTTSIFGFCTTQDIDFFIQHMNNARYVRELDFARFNYYALSGLFGEIKKARGGIVVGASSVRYRRAIPVFSFYRLETKLIWWDEKAIYLEQKFISTSDNFVRAIVTSKQSITNVNVLDLMKKFPECAKERPPVPEELEFWLKGIEVSSKNLRKEQ